MGPDREPDDGALFFVGEFDSAGEQIAEGVVLSVGCDDLGDEGVRECCGCGHGGLLACGGCSYEVRRWYGPGAKSFDPDDGDVYYLVVKHYVEAWATRLSEPYERQRYALVVEIEDRERTTLDLHATLQNQIRNLNAIRVRLGGPPEPPRRQ